MLQPCAPPRRDRRGRADDALAQRDDGEQAVAFGDMVRMPGRAALSLRQDRAGEFDDGENGANRALGDRRLTRIWMIQPTCATEIAIA